MKFRFHKMHGCGNDFVVIDHLAGIPEGFDISRELAAKISHRQFGIGCDQILWLKPASAATGAEAGGKDALVWILNSDGSRAEMCGNGMRAVGMHLGLRGPSPGRSRYEVLVSAGRAPIPVGIDLSGPYPEVALGVPTVFEAREKVPLDGPSLGLRTSTPGLFTRVEIGNPHAIFFLGEENPQFGDLGGLDLPRVGSFIETNKLFPNRTNVEFVSIETPNRIRVRVWERGAGATLACGSGACASVAAAEVRGFTRAGDKIEVVLPGGSVFVRLEKGWREGKGSALLSGPATDVFTGEWSS